MKLLVATRSHGKQREFRRLLADAGVALAFPDELGLVESAIEDDLETADTFLGNATLKAAYFMRLSGLPTLADDSGLEVDALGGAPGVRSKRWAGATGTSAEVDAANNAELLTRLGDLPDDQRRARFRCVLVLLRPTGEPPVVADGVCEGLILREADGSGGFGYDPLFWANELGATLAAADEGAKNRVSHRGRACETLLRMRPAFC